MSGFLLTYATTHGQTAKIAGALAEAMREAGAEVVVRDVAEVSEEDVAAADAFVVGGPLYRTHHPRALVDWIKAHRSELAERPSAFFSVSLTASEDSDEARAATQKCIEDLADETGWKPRRTDAVAGALQYSQYDFFTRTLMRLIMRREGHPVDPHKDHEFTDWDAVGRLGRELAELRSA